MRFIFTPQRHQHIVFAMMNFALTLFALNKEIASQFGV